MMAKRCCGTCKWWDRTSALGPSGKRVSPQLLAYCLWPIPEPPKYPAAWHWERSGLGMTQAADGQTCKCWEAR